MNDHAELRRLFAREQAIEAELRQVRARQAEIGNRVSFAAGLRVPLRGAALKRFVEAG
jgi:hypothetical protein